MISNTQVKGEMVAGFLSGLSRTRDKLRGAGSSGGTGSAGSPGLLSAQSSVDSASSPAAGHSRWGTCSCWFVASSLLRMLALVICMATPGEAPAVTHTTTSTVVHVSPGV